MVDYLVVGAGIVGLTTASYIKSMSPGSSVLVIDRAPGPGAGDSGRSVAAIRAFFTNRVNLMLANSSIEMYRAIQERGIDLGLKFVGYLFLADRKLMSVVGDGLKEADKMGLEYKILEPNFLRESLGIRTEVSGSEEAELVGVGDIEAGILVPKAGIIRAERVIEYYYNAAKALGVSFAFSTEAKELIIEPRRPLGIEGEPFPWQEARVAGVRTADGREIRAKKTILATGSWTWRLSSPAGAESYTRPKKRQVFAVKAVGGLERTLRAKGVNPYGISPFMILPRRVYMRPVIEEGAFWIGMSDDLGRPFESDGEPVAEPDFYVKGILPIASLYFPELQERYPSSMWAGYYDLSPDKLPIIYEPYDSDLVISCGTSGSGIMKADAIGRITASLALGMEEAELFTGERMRTDLLGVKNRVSGAEKLVI